MKNEECTIKNEEFNFRKLVSMNLLWQYDDNFRFYQNIRKLNGDNEETRGGESHLT